MILLKIKNYLFGGVILKINVFGFGKGDFKDQKTGFMVEGKKIYYAYKDPNREELVGMATGYIFIPTKKAEKIDFHSLLNSQICEASFNQFGNLISIEPCIKNPIPADPEDDIYPEAV
jgi:hypothetical protein